MTPVEEGQVELRGGYVMTFVRMGFRWGYHLEGPDGFTTRPDQMRKQYTTKKATLLIAKAEVEKLLYKAR